MFVVSVGGIGEIRLAIARYLVSPLRPSDSSSFSFRPLVAFLVQYFVSILIIYFSLLAGDRGRPCPFFSETSH